KLAPIGVGAAEATDQVCKRAGNQEILLQKTQALSFGRGIVGIQNGGKRLGCERPRYRAREFSAAEFLKIEIITRGSSPKAKRIDRPSAITDNRSVAGYAKQSRWTPRDRAEGTTIQLERAVQPHFDDFIRAIHFPGIRMAQPVIPLFTLPAI